MPRPTEQLHREFHLMHAAGKLATWQAGLSDEERYLLLDALMPVRDIQTFQELAAITAQRARLGLVLLPPRDDQRVAFLYGCEAVYRARGSSTPVLPETSTRGLWARLAAWWKAVRG